MKVKMFAALFCLLTAYAFSVTPAPFTLIDIEEQPTASHTRLQFTIDTGVEFFPWMSPYTGEAVIGYRIFMSKYPIPDEDPQYEFVQYYLPFEGYDLKRTFWIIKPEGLASRGNWYIKIDGIDKERNQVATCPSTPWVFGPVGEAYKSDPVFFTTRVWESSVALMNPTDDTVTVSLLFYDEFGNVIACGDVAHHPEYTVLLGPRQTYTQYIRALLEERGHFEPYAGSVTMTASAPISYLLICFSTIDAKILNVAGVLK